MSEIILFHFNHPKGKKLSSLRKFNTDEELKAAGWTDDPDNIEEPTAGKSAGFTAEQAEDADPDVLVGMVKSMGFHVLTDIELQAEKNKGEVVPVKRMPDEEIVAVAKSLGYHVLIEDDLQSLIATAIDAHVESMPVLSDITAFDDGALAAEVSRRSGEKTAAIVSSLRERFDAEPTELNKEDLVVLGKEAFELPLKMTMKEETLIGHISKAIADSK